MAKKKVPYVVVTSRPPKSELYIIALSDLKKTSRITKAMLKKNEDNRNAKESIEPAKGFDVKFIMAEQTT
jgi:hypothetical protein